MEKCSFCKLYRVRQELAMKLNLGRYLDKERNILYHLSVSLRPVVSFKGKEMEYKMEKSNSSPNGDQNKPQEGEGKTSFLSRRSRGEPPSLQCPSEDCHCDRAPIHSFNAETRAVFLKSCG